MIECNVCKEPSTETRVRGLRVFTCTSCDRELRPNGDPVPINYSAEASKRRTLEILAETYADAAKEGRD